MPSAKHCPHSGGNGTHEKQDKCRRSRRKPDYSSPIYLASGIFGSRRWRTFRRRRQYHFSLPLLVSPGRQQLLSSASYRLILVDKEFINLSINL